jgi:ATP-dependent DNA ligase
VSPRVSLTLPTVEPILLTPRGDPFDDPAWLFEPKYDGYRGLLYVTRKGCHFRSKRGNVLKRFEELTHRVREQLPVKEAILDGEVVALDSGGRQNFRDLTVGRGSSTMPRRRSLDRREGSATAIAHPAKAVANETHSRDDAGALSGVLD